MAARKDDKKVKPQSKAASGEEAEETSSSGETSTETVSKRQQFVDPHQRNIWMRGLLMIIFAIFFGIAEFLLGVCAVIQFIWMVISKKPNEAIAGFGEGLGRWLERVTLFQTGATEKLPFPWSDWERGGD